MERRGSAVWTGKLKEGKGIVSTGSKALVEIPYSFSMRFEDAPGTNPEELIAAAHAACFSMALSGELEKDRLTPEQIRTTATVFFERVENRWTISRIRLDVAAKVPGASEAEFVKAADAAKTGCPVSRALRADISLNAHLE